VEASAPAFEKIPPVRIAGCLLATAALVVGVWYAAFGTSLLLNLPVATHRFIVLAGDQDFWLDYRWFRAAGTVLAVLALVLGVFTLRATGKTFVSRYEPRRHWLLLMSIAALVGLLRVVAEHFAGVLTPSRLISVASVCALYAVLSVVDKPPRRGSLFSARSEVIRTAGIEKRRNEANGENERKPN
jgi:hypothetical protein